MRSSDYKTTRACSPPSHPGWFFVSFLASADNPLPRNPPRQNSRTFARLTVERSMAMFKDKSAFSSYSVNDLKAAKNFYSQALGLDVAESKEGLELKVPGGGKAFLYPKPNHQPATFTVLNFVVNDVEQAVDDLTKRGVRMEQYNQGDIKTDEHGIFRGQEKD